MRIGLESICEGNEATIKSMLSLGDDKSVVEGLIDCMGVNSLSAEMLMANYFSQGMLGTYCSQRLGKSDKGGAATLAERIAREWAKPSFNPLPAAAGTKRKEPEPPAEDAAVKRAAAMADLMAKRAAKVSSPAKPAAASGSSAGAQLAQEPASAAAAPDEEERPVSHASDERAARIRALESCDVEEAVEGLLRAKLTCEDVLAGLMQWSDMGKAAEFVREWEDSLPIFGCDLELMCEAIPRIGLCGVEALTKAGRLLGAVYSEEDDKESASEFAGFWDVPDNGMAEADRQAFLDAGWGGGGGE